MSANFIFESPTKMRTTNFSPSITYDIGELNFYVSVKFGSNFQVFLILKNQKGIYDIVELTKTNTSTGLNVLYKLPINQTLRVNKELVEASLLVLNNDGTYNLSNAIKVFVSTENYALARQVYIAQEVGKAVQDCYSKVLLLTEKNEEMHKNLLMKTERG